METARSIGDKAQRQGTTARSKDESSGSRSLTDRLPMYDSGLLKSATSYPFTNFPQNWSPKRLWYLFATYGAGLGRIVDVFIPKKKDRKRKLLWFRTLLRSQRQRKAGKVAEDDLLWH
ncbi:hypothetical protein SLE2022_311160 [Rubroshorea leprosula]